MMRMIAVVSMMLSGCGWFGDISKWRIEKIAQIGNFAAPESACIDPETGDVLISNIDVPPGGDDSKWNAEDGTGFITRLKAGGGIKAMRWADSVPNAPIHSAKGVCILKGILYICDINCVRRISVKTGRPLPPIVVSGSVFLNDAATDGKCVYVSDTFTEEAKSIYRIDGDEHVAIPGPPSANGIAFANGRMYVASWEAHEIYEVDPRGRKPFKAFGLAGRFGGLDGIEVLDDGTFVVSDQKNGTIVLVGANRRSTRTLIKVNGPADFGIDRARGLLYIPMIHDNALVVYKLTKK